MQRVEVNVRGRVRRSWNRVKNCQSELVARDMGGGEAGLQVTAKSYDSSPLLRDDLRVPLLGPAELRRESSWRHSGHTRIRGT